jgi:hypothetical protein
MSEGGKPPALMMTPVAKPKGIEKIIRSRISTGNYKPGSKSYTVNYSLLGRLRNRTQKNGNAEQAKIFENLRTKMEAQYSGTEPEQIVSAIPLAVSGMKEAGDSAPAAPPSSLAALPAAPPAAPPSSLAAPPPPPAAPNVAAVPPSNVQEIHTCPDGNDESFTLGKDELQDGNCFYSSLYKSALHHSKEGLVNRIYELFDGKPLEAPASLDERTFIMEVRTKTAQLLRNDIYQEMKAKHLRNINADKSILTKEGREGQKAQTLTLFEKLWDNKGNAIYRAWLQESPREIKSFFKEQSFISRYTSRDSNNEKQFYNDMAKFIETWGVYASQTDIDVVKHELLKGGIALETISDEGQKKCMYFGKIPVLWLFKQASPNERGELISGDHYGYFRKDDSPPVASASASSSVSELPPAAPASSSVSELAPAAPASASIHSSKVKITDELPEKSNNGCLQLYHPCTKQPISTLKELENVVREIKRNKIKELSESLKWPSEISTRLDLLQHILNMETFIDETFFKYSKNGQVYEALWDIVIALGYTVNHEGKPMFEKTREFRISLEKLDGKKDLDIEKLKTDGIDYLENRNVDMGASGSSDITFAYIGNKTKTVDKDPCSFVDKDMIASDSIYFCSSKFFKDDSTKSATEDLDIPKIFISAKNIDISYKKHIIILVKDRDIINAKLKRALHKEISEEASYVLGMKELFASLRQIYDIRIFRELRENKTEITKETIKNYFQIVDSTGKILNPRSLQLRIHQMMAVDKISDSIKEFNKNVELNKRSSEKITLNNKFLIGILPRGGKTYIAGGIVRDTQLKTIVVILGAKSETLDQFKDDLFDVKMKGMSDFKDYSVIDVKDEDVNFEFNSSKKYILIMSAELFKMHDEYISLTDYYTKHPGASHAELISHLQSIYNFKQAKPDKAKDEYARKVVDGWLSKGRPQMKRKFLRELQGKVPGGRRADLFICDEAHLKQVTHNAVKAMAGATLVTANPITQKDQDSEEISEEEEIAQINKELSTVSSDIPIVYMTGTYFKPLKAFKPPTSQVALWVYEDIEMAKNLRDNEEYFVNKFGKYYSQALARCLSYNQTYESIQLTYERFPRLNLITTSFTEEAKLAFEEQRAEGRGFSTMPQLFKLNNTKWVPTNDNVNSWYDQFNNTAGMIRLINYLSPQYSHVKNIKTTDKVEPVLSINSALTSVDIIAQRHEDRLRLFTSEFKVHTQLWFLPKVSESGTVDQRMCALAGCIFQNKWFRKNFVVLGVSSSGKWNISNSKDSRVKISPKDGSENEEDVGEFTWACPSSTTPSLKKCIINEEREARKKKKGLIILAQDMLHLGISLECVDIVVLLDDSKNIDERIQKMYRALTESYSDDTIFKRAGFIIDMNYFRTVNALVDYQIIATKAKAVDSPTPLDIKDAIKKTLNLYAVDNDGSVLQSQIENDTIIELKKNYKSSYLTVRNAGDKLDEDINEFLEGRYNSSEYDTIFESIRQEKGKKTRSIRKDESGVNSAKEHGGGGKVPKERVPGEKADDIYATNREKSEAFKNSIRTTLKLGIFGSDITNIHELLKLIKGEGPESEDFREILYDTIIKRGNISAPNTPSALELFEEKIISKTQQMKRNKTPKLNKKENPLYTIVTIKSQIDNIYKLLINDIKSSKTLDIDRYINSKKAFSKYSADDKQIIKGLVLELIEEYEKLSKDELETLNGELNDEEDNGEEIKHNSLSCAIKFKTSLLDMEWRKLPEEEKRSYIDASKELLDNEEKRKNNLFKHVIIPELEEISQTESRDLYTGMKRGYNDQSQSNEKFTEVLEYIVEHLAPKDTERHKFGEVFTPLELVDEMLSKLPQEASDNVWNKEDWKWLDPANGIGNFPIKAILGQTDGIYEGDGPYKGKKRFTYPGLLKGLRDKFPSDEACLKHIIENMLFMVDINSKNNLITKNLLKKMCPDAKANISKIGKQGFLTETTTLDFGEGKKIKEFHIIMGNPPYQSGAVKSVGTTATRKMREDTGFTTDLNKNLWIPFVNAALDKFLIKSGYLLFIHPIGWFKPDGLKPQTDLHNKMLEKQIIYMRIYKDNQASKLFKGHGAISLSYYLLQNKNNTDKTVIYDMLDNTDHIKLNKESVIILAYNNILKNIMSKCALIRDTTDYMQKSLANGDCDDNSPYKNVVNVTEDGKILIVRSRDELKKRDNTSITKMPKIFIDGINYPRILYDKKVEYGIIGQNQHYLVGDNLDRQEEYFKTKLSVLLLASTKFRQNFIEPRYYPDVRLLKDNNGKEVEITDSSLADFFRFTPKEIKAIDDYAKSINFDPNRKYVYTEISCSQMGKKIKDENKQKTEKKGKGAAKPRRVTRKLRRT